MIRTQNSRYTTDDPLTLAMRPPATETEAEKDVRLKEEAKARQRSEKIDEELKAERNKLQKSKDDVRVSNIYIQWPSLLSKHLAYSCSY